MAQDLSNDEIAMLCDIAQLDASKLQGDRKRDLERLMREGYVVATGLPTPPFKLTAKGSTLLGARGAGLNEA